MNNLTPRLRDLLARCLPIEEAERCLHELSRELRGGVPVRRTVYYRADETTGQTIALRRPTSRSRSPR